jgi:hypothetical protein
MMMEEVETLNYPDFHYFMMSINSNTLFDRDLTFIEIFFASKIVFASFLYIFNISLIIESIDGLNSI